MMKKKSESEIKREERNHLMNTIAERCAYYRSNPHRFAKDYLNIKLKTFQKILIYEMMHNNYITYAAARGQGA